MKTTNHENEYAIIRMFRDGRNRKIIKRGVTLQQAQDHCSREDTHEVLANGDVVWFDGYTHMDKL